ncbi:FAD/NAD-P-binding domain-containing protein [Russula ochroleuca]|uniref:FAD/NAD-P-binding domain-containing protein n=1 Tax=Russula ochroleuca TaxID=152965 RepID=A0A9P5MQM5_9AGAM|nr:FAD/NAD-P-binding domain-containing protein [Russula ochroleuca]
MDVDGGSFRRQHQSFPSASFRRPSHTTDVTPTTDDTSRQASLHLDFIIIGAGIAGLSAAYALAKSGHRVQVFEQARGLKYQTGGVRLPPNATRILTHWGVEKELAQKGSISTSSSLLDMKTGRQIGRSAWQAALFEEMGSSFFMMHYADLLDVLFRLASSAGARVNFGVTVESVEPARETGTINTPIAGPASRTLRPTVRLKTGERFHADVIIGADGRRSMIRRVVTDKDDEPEANGLSVYTGSVPAAKIRNYAPLKQLVDVVWPFWLGHRRIVLAYPVRRHQEFIVNVLWEDRSGFTAAARPAVIDSWDPTTSLTSLRYKEGQMDPRARCLLDMVGPVSRQSWNKIPPPETWVDESESIILIGDAAHPQGPVTGCGSYLALEDAAILGGLFSRLRSADQVPTLLYAYMDLRKGRADGLVAMEQHNVEVGMSSPSRIRDGLVRWSALPADVPESGPTETELAEISEVWGYFAIDAADEWWVEWGLLRERSQLRM